VGVLEVPHFLIFISLSLSLFLVCYLSFPHFPIPVFPIPAIDAGTYIPAEFRRLFFSLTPPELQVFSISPSCVYSLV
jgi:hypothetical protein